MRAFRVAYDGRPYHGFQRQPDVPTVEGTLLDGLSALGVVETDTDTPPGYAAAGRTDAGVSAIRQTIAFETPEWLTPRAFNGELPGTVRVWAHADVTDRFHATHDAQRRTYVYYLYAPDSDEQSLVRESRVDRDRLVSALRRLSGTHDFSNFTPDTTGTERTVSAEVQREAQFLKLRIEAGGFPREFVRRLVTLCRGIATGDAPFAKIDRVLTPTPLEGPEGIGPAPPEALVLWDVTYDLQFQTDTVAATTARKAFEERHADAATAAKVTAEIQDEIGKEDS